MRCDRCLVALDPSMGKESARSNFLRDDAIRRVTVDIRMVVGLAGASRGRFGYSS